MYFFLYSFTVDYCRRFIYWITRKRQISFNKCVYNVATSAGLQQTKCYVCGSETTAVTPLVTSRCVEELTLTCSPWPCVWSHPWPSWRGWRWTDRCPGPRTAGWEKRQGSGGGNMSVDVCLVCTRIYNIYIYIYIYTHNNTISYSMRIMVETNCL